MVGIHEKFPSLFTEPIEEDEDRQGDEEDNNEDNGQSIGFGIVPYVMMFCKATNHNLEEAMNYDIFSLLYFVGYEVFRLKKEKEQIEKMQKR